MNIYKKIFLGITIFFIVLISFLIFFFIYFNNRLFKEEFNSPIKDDFSLLLIGTDESIYREENLGLADAIILTTFSPGNIENNEMPSATITSIPRDSYVYIPCANTYDKITHSYSYGEYYDDNGTQCVVETVENLFNISIDYYVKTNFDGIIAFVDAIGGIDVNVAYDFCEKDVYDNEDAICFTEGPMHLDGAQTLSYSRQRYYSSDYERSIRQQEVIFGIAKQTALYASEIQNISELADIYSEYFVSNINFKSLLTILDFIIYLESFLIDYLSYGGVIVIENYYHTDGYFSNKFIDYALIEMTSYDVPYCDIYLYCPEYRENTSVNTFVIDGNDLPIEHKSSKVEMPEQIVFSFESFLLENFPVTIDGVYYGGLTMNIYEYAIEIIHENLNLNTIYQIDDNLIIE